MKIELKKFGGMLISRHLGREAFAAFQQNLKDLKDGENLEVYFDDVAVFSPSWADEFLVPLHKRLKNRLILKKTENASVEVTLDLLGKIKNITWVKEDWLKK